MLQSVFKARAIDPDFATSTVELLQSTTRSLLLAIGGAYMLWHTVAAATWPEVLGARVYLMTLVFVIGFTASFRLLERRILLSEIIWQLTLLICTTMGVLLFRQPMVALAYLALPFLAVLTIGPLAGLLAQLLVGACVWGIGALGLVPLPVSLVAAITVGGLLAWLIGWSSSRTLYTATEWSLQSLRQARKNLADAQEHRAQLSLVVKDLDQAYYRLDRSNSALVAAWRDAEESERQKAEFAATVSHEMRTPLNLVVGFADMMMNAPESYGGVPLPGPYRGDLNAIYNSSRHLLQLVDDVLDLSGIDAGKIGLSRDRVDFRGLVQEAVGMVSDYVQAKRLDLVAQVPDDLPPFTLDRLRVRQVLLNLLVNAVRFTERGGIRVEAVRGDRFLEVRVIDTGRGIAPEDLPRVFQEFRSSEQSATGWHRGTGLGLPISKKLVELHQGQMGVDSTLQLGTTFWFRLPLEADEAAPSRGTIIRPKALGLSPRHERKVLLVHPDRGVGRLLQRHLSAVTFVQATDPAEAALLAEEHRVVAVVTSEQPLAVRLPSGMPLIHCPLPDSRSVARRLGARDILVKPIEREELLASLEREGVRGALALVADDDPEMVRLLRRMLRGYDGLETILEAHTGVEALEMARAERPELVLLDLAMPEMGGLEVVRLLAADPATSDIAVFILSAKAQDLIEGERTGSLCVEKAAGFSLGELIRILEANLSAFDGGWFSDLPTGAADATGSAAR
ncbi:MAG: ATP-binding response regulator [Anaerolineae bacterium]